MKYSNGVVMVLLGLLVACVQPETHNANSSNSGVSTVTDTSSTLLSVQPSPTEQPISVPQSDLEVQREAVIQQVSVQDLASATGDYLVLDVREPWEYWQGYVAGAQLIPLGELEARAHEIRDGQAIYVICRSGNRSMTASRILQTAGKRDIRNVQGGIIAWQHAGFAVEQSEEGQ